jgi:hypothetical protein
MANKQVTIIQNFKLSADYCNVREELWCHCGLARNASLGVDLLHESTSRGAGAIT